MAASPSTPPEPPASPAGIPQTGVTEDERLKGAIAYILSIITGIVVLLIADNNKFVQFHAWQSVVVGVIVFVVFFVLSSTVILSCIGFIIAVAVWLYTWYGAYLVYTGKPFRIPYVADFVEKNLVKA